MSHRVDRVKLDEVDWLSIMPWLRLFRCFRSAVHPSKLLTAWLFVVLIFAVAGLCSTVSDPVYAGEIARFRLYHTGQISEAKYEAWRDTIANQVREQETDNLRTLVQNGALTESLVNAESTADFFDEARALVHTVYLDRYDEAVKAGETDPRTPQDFQAIRNARRAALHRLHQQEPKPVFEAALNFKLDAIDRLCRAAIALEWGWDELIGSRDAVASTVAVSVPGDWGDTLDPNGAPMPARAAGFGGDNFQPAGSPTVFGALKDLLIVLPAWLWHTHCWFLVLYLIAAWWLWSYFGAALSRMTAMQTARHTRLGLADAQSFVRQQWWSYLFVPIAPAFVIGAVSLFMMIAGVVLFSWVLDIIGGALFFVALAAGFALAFAIFVMIGGFQLFYPAISFEGAGVFDAVSRGASYVLNRPWRWLFYSMVATVYGAVTYLFLGFVLFLTLWVTHKVMGQWVVADNLMGVDRFEELMPAPTPGNPTPPIDYEALNGTGALSAWLIRFWVLGLVALLYAYGVSFYSCAQSWIYALLRRSVDGVGFSDIVEAEGEMPAAAPDKVEPGREG